MKSKIIRNGIISVLCVAMLTTGLTFFFTARAEEINETNPDLNFQVIDSNLEELYGESGYNCTGSFAQSGGNYSVKTNAYCVWKTVDDVSFAYKEYKVSNKDNDNLVVTTTVNSMAAETSTQSLHANASAGIMLRAGLNADAAEVFFHIRAREVMVVYRSKDGSSTGVQYTGIVPVFPISLKVEKKGNMVTCSFKTAEMSNWFSLRPVGMQASGPLFAGLAAHSVDRNTNIVANFSGFSATGIGTYTPDGSGGTSSGNESEPEQVFVQPDPPNTDATLLLRETFTDGSLVNTPASVTNPVWNNPKEVSILTLPDGNRVWDKNFVSTQDYIGDQHWTDYYASMDVNFSENCDPEPLNASNRVKLYARHIDNEFYGNSDYAAVLEYGNTVNLYKRTHVADSLDENGTRLATITVDDYLGKGVHNLAIQVFDNVIRVYWDKNELIKYVDDGVNVGFAYLVHTKGSIGVYSNETSVTIDNIIVRKLTDTMGGDYDNTIGGNWNEPVPDFVTNWQANKYPY